MIKAQIKERYIASGGGIKRQGVKEILHETRYFSSYEKFREWYDSFKEELWEDDEKKVDLVEGIYVTSEEVEMDNIEKPNRLRLYATFRPGVSYYYEAG